MTLRRKKRSSRKRPAATSSRSVAVGGGDHAHVDAARRRAADAQHLALLQHAQQLGLEVGADLADLVEEQRAAVGALEAAGARRLPRR